MNYFNNDLSVLMNFKWDRGHLLAYKNDHFIKVGFWGKIKRSVSQLFCGKGFSDCKRDFIATKINEFFENNKERLKTTDVNEINKKFMKIKNTLLEFYSGTGVDSKGRSLIFLHDLSGEEKEKFHDYIQWLFPTKTKSAYNNDAPILSDDLLKILTKSPKVIKNLKASFKEMMLFYGFRYDEKSNRLHSLGKVEREDSILKNKIAPIEWFTSGDHNLLRITRILECLNHFGLTNEAEALFKKLRSKLKKLEKTDPKTFSKFKETYLYWKSKMKLEDHFEETLFVKEDIDFK